MLLPQSSAFTSLYNRLRCVPALGTLPKCEKFVSPRKLDGSKLNVKFNDLLLDFQFTHDKHQQAYLESRRASEDNLK